MAVRLRPHHLLCMLTFVGKGYSAAFVANYMTIARRLSGGEEIEVVAGPDDICRPLLHDPGAHCRAASVEARDDQAAEAVSAILGRPVGPGARVTPDRMLVARLRSAFRAQAFRDACEGCQWTGLCSRVAASRFDGVKVMDGAIPAETATGTSVRPPE